MAHLVAQYGATSADVERPQPELKLTITPFSRSTIAGTKCRMQFVTPMMFTVMTCANSSAEVAPYCATKWAIEGLTQALAQELPRGMAAVPLNPGIINTEMLQSCFGGSAHHYPTPDEWSRTAVPFLLQLGAKDNGRPVSVA
jgi:NAD(P)-dependent dehydrogenase (short-subunit alcohol dehydrogenase family)